MTTLLDDGIAGFGDVFGSLFGFTPSEPPDTVPLRILGLGAMPASRAHLKSAFRTRLLLVHPDANAYQAVPELQRAADKLAMERPEVAELVWARDALLRKIPTDVTDKTVARERQYEPSRCKVCGEPWTDWRTKLHERGQWEDYCYRCAEKAENARQRDQRHRARADRACESCGHTFTPPRSDGRYCSPACRQKAYRQRKVRP